MTKILIIGILAGFLVNSVIDIFIHEPFGLLLVRQLTISVTCLIAVAAWTDRRQLIASWHTRHLRKAPPVLDEDGNVRVPVLLAGERLDVLMDLDQRPLAAAVVRPDGSIRVQADWRHR